MLIKFKPTTPGLRGTVLVSKKELSKAKPYKSLTKKIISTGGRNNQGRITSRRMGGGVKRKYRIIDFKRSKIDVSAEIMEKNNLSSSDISWLVPHQANKRIIDATARRMGVGNEKVMINIEKYGNTTNGTIPLCLWEWENQLRKGDNIILAAFGGGFTWGSIYMKWAYDS